MINRGRLVTYCSIVLLGAVALPFIKVGESGRAPAATRVVETPVRRVMAVAADDPKTFEGNEAFNRLVKLAQERHWKDLPMGELIGAIGMELRGTPYVGSTLELYEDREVCSVNLTGLDCVTFFESALGFARMLKEGKEMSPAALMEQVTYTRYRDGKISDYASRLHYTADWLYNNEEKRVVKVITRELPGAVRFTSPVNFMSKHPASYKQLKANPDMVPHIAEIEDRINARNMYYVPKDKVAEIEPLLKTGDIIGITTTINGIDCSHTGLCYRDEQGVLRFLHASLDKKQVVLGDELSKYLASVSKHTGIMVARPAEVR